jgi:hypothetical protein
MYVTFFFHFNMNLHCDWSIYNFMTFNLLLTLHKVKNDQASLLSFLNWIGLIEKYWQHCCWMHRMVADWQSMHSVARWLFHLCKQSTYAGKAVECIWTLVKGVVQKWDNKIDLFAVEVHTLCEQGNFWWKFWNQKGVQNTAYFSVLHVKI